MPGEFDLTDFAPEYLDRLLIELIPALKKAGDWVEASVMASDPVMFMSAVVTLAERGYFDDQNGYCRIEVGCSCTRLRHISYKEIEWRFRDNEVKVPPVPYSKMWPRLRECDIMVMPTLGHLPACND